MDFNKEKKEVAAFNPKYKFEKKSVQIRENNNKNPVAAHILKSTPEFDNLRGI